jgi:hypothetical protein
MPQGRSAFRPKRRDGGAACMAHSLSGHAVHDVAVIEDVHPIGKCHCGGDVLFNQQDRLASVRKGSAGGKKVMNDDRSETLERLVQQQDFRLPYERARSPASVVRRRKDRCRGLPGAP